MTTEGSRTVEKTLALLDCFSIDRTELTLSQFQEISGYPASTLFRLLTSLHQCGFLEYNSKTKQYSPGIKFIRLGFLASEAFDVYRVAKPYMLELKGETGETITLFVRRDLSKVCIGRVESDHAVRYSAKLGDALPLYVGASGKVLMSHLTDEEIRGLVEKIGIKRLTSRSDTSIEQILEKIKFVRENGYAMSRGERQAGSAGIGVPLTDFRGNVLASLNITLPAERVREDIMPGWIDKLKKTGAEISKRLGGGGGSS